jgi:acyl carrier protein
MQDEQILSIIQEGLQVEDGRVNLESAMSNVFEWDSLGHLGILAALDTHFDGKIGDIREMATANSVADIIRLLRENSII